MSPVGRSPAGEPCPPASLAWRQYRVKLESGQSVILGFSLADPADATMAQLKEEHAAQHLGLLVVLDDPESLEEVVLWFQEAASLTLISQNGETQIGDEVRRLLPHYFSIFFDEIKELAPELAYVTFRTPGTPNSTLH